MCVIPRYFTHSQLSQLRDDYPVCELCLFLYTVQSITLQLSTITDNKLSLISLIVAQSTVFRTAKESSPSDIVKLFSISRVAGI